MTISTNNANSFQGGAATSAFNKDMFPPFLGSGSNLVPPNADGDILIILGSDATNSTTTGIVVPGLSFPLTAGKLYLIEGFIYSDAPGATIGFQFLHGTVINVGGNPPNTLVDTINSQIDSALTLSTTLFTGPRLLTTYSAGTNSLNAPFNTPHKFITICRAASSGFGVFSDQLQFLFRSEVAGSTVTINAGSFLRVREMT